MTIDRLIKLRDKVRSKKPPRYSRFFSLSLGTDGNFYFDNQTERLMTKRDDTTDEYWRSVSVKNWKKNSTVVDHDNCRWYVVTNLPEHQVSNFINLYEWSLRNGRIRTYRLD